jgi:hypothetical protein
MCFYYLPINFWISNPFTILPTKLETLLPSVFGLLAAFFMSSLLGTAAFSGYFAD